MALRSLDDKYLGEKVNNYCSSSEEEEEESSSEITAGDTTVLSPPKRERNTGPKGVIEDWKTFKRNERLRKLEEEKEKERTIKAMLMTCKPDEDMELDDEDKDFLEEYSKQRMVELQHKFSAKSAGISFGKVVELDTENYVEQIEEEEKFVSIIIHLYDDNLEACQAMNGCFQVLADKYKTVKFCRIKATDAKLSMQFQDNALPALLVYKNNVVIGNFIKVSDVIGEDFFASDVEAFLLSYSLLPLDEKCL